MIVFYVPPQPFFGYASRMCILPVKATTSFQQSLRFVLFEINNDIKNKTKNFFMNVEPSG
jgi:hypothetical protein